MENKKSIGLIKGFPLIKFQTADRIKMFQDGLLYMNSLATFREMYRDAQDNVIGDPNEGKLVIHEAVMFIEGSSRPQVIHDQALSTAGENDFVFCMYGVNSEKRATSAFSEEFKCEIQKKYDTALLVTDQQQFFNRVAQKVLADSLDMKGDFVQYYDPQSDDVGRLLSLLKGGMHRIGFFKTNNYAYQQEYRFAMPNPQKSDHYELNIGSIKDISQILPITEALKCSFVQTSKEEI